MEYHKGNHSVYALQYHIILVTKYRSPCIKGDLRDTLHRELTRLIEQSEGSVISVESDLDHVHILADLSPRICIATFMGVLKGVSARIVRRDYKEYLRPYLWGDSFWEDSYFIATSGGVTLETLKHYVESQPTKKRRPGRPRKQQPPQTA